MTSRLSTALLVLTSALSVAFLAIVVLFVHQPWRTCPNEDVPAACAALPGDFAVTSLAVLGLLLSAAGFVVVAIVRRARRRERATA